MSTNRSTFFYLKNDYFLESMDRIALNTRGIRVRWTQSYSSCHVPLIEVWFTDQVSQTKLLVCHLPVVHLVAGKHAEKSSMP